MAVGNEGYSDTQGDESEDGMGPERVRELDALRGFALFGILVVNIWFFADPWTLAGGPNPDRGGAVDTAVRFAVSALFEAKFYLLFSFLFGYSFVLQWGTAYRSKASPVPRTLRRLGLLAALGLLHGFLLFYGDILLTYALLGLILLATRTISSRSAVIAGLAITGTVGGLLLITGLIATAIPLDQLLEPASQAASPAAVLAANVDTYLTILPSVVLFQGPLALAMFYLGFAAGKARLLERGPARSLLRRTSAICLPLGLTAGVIQAFLTNYVDRESFSILAAGISTLTAPLLTAGYVSLLLLWFQTRTGSHVRDALAAAGRMPLTNYLAQSCAMAWIFTAYGFGLVNLLPFAAVLGVAVVIFALQLVISALWLRRFKQGPVEWLLRRATYWREPAVRG